jgi:hypothetical protein
VGSGVCATTGCGFSSERHPVKTTAAIQSKLRVDLWSDKVSHLDGFLLIVPATRGAQVHPWVID